MKKIRKSSYPKFPSLGKFIHAIFGQLGHCQMRHNLTCEVTGSAYLGPTHKLNWPRWTSDRARLSWINRDQSGATAFDGDRPSSTDIDRSPPRLTDVHPRLTDIDWWPLTDIVGCPSISTDVQRDPPLSTRSPPKSTYVHRDRPGWPVLFYNTFVGIVGIELLFLGFFIILFSSFRQKQGCSHKLLRWLVSVLFFLLLYEYCSQLANFLSSPMCERARNPDFWL